MRSANHLTEAQMKEYFGWTQSSKIAAIYVHLSGRDVDNAILQLHGLRPKNVQKEKHLTPITCLRCKSQNPATHKYCMLCGTHLTEEAASEVFNSDHERKKADSILDKLIDDPEVRAILKKKVKEMKDNGSD